MRLTEFLLARITEDEAQAHKWLERQVRWPSRKILAECEAKRLIVALRRVDMMLAGEIAESSGDAWESFSDDRRAITRSEFLAHRNVLRLLALPYADHPDYDEEWRA